MQRTEPDGVVIACDFCGTDWDEVKSMVEGHRGSVLCLACLKLALDQVQTGSEGFTCTMCLRDLPAHVPRWAHPSPGSGANAEAVACRDCLDQATNTFSKDPDVAWEKPV